MTEPLLLQARYRNKLERDVGAQLREAGVAFEYEGGKVPYVVPQRTAKYLPDFRVGNIIIESKGYWGRSAKDRHKFLLIRESNPELDIRFVFSDSKKKIYKGSPTTYADWCDTYGFLYGTKGVIPKEWFHDIREAAKNGSGKKSKRPKPAGTGSAG